MFYNSSLPEVYDNESSSIHNVDVTKPTLKWLLIIMAFTVAAAIAVGVSVGIWHHREHLSSESSPFIRYRVRMNYVSP